MLPLVARETILARVVCPRCQGRLHGDPAAGGLVCSRCADVFPQRGTEWVDVLRHGPESDDAGWQERQREMLAAYDDLIADPPHARLAYRNDFDPLRPLLAPLAGIVLDIGGGNGLLRHVLPPAVDYVSLDPEPRWLSERWLAIADDYPCLRQPLAFVGGIAEALPFPDRSVDGVTSIWSLNHCREPSKAIAETQRVLRPGGRLLIVLDDVPPRWTDILTGTYLDPRFPSRADLISEKIVSVARGWPLQPDHVRILERDIARWAHGLQCSGRGFLGSYLWMSFARPAG